MENPILPKPITKLDEAFGESAMELLPPYSEIPEEFKAYHGNKWGDWAATWFFKGLEKNPEPKEGIDLNMAMSNLACIQRSFQPKHEHKTAGVAYLASLWFEKP